MLNIYRTSRTKMGINDAVMKFGKHKGVPIKNVPNSYLHWLLREDKKKSREMFGSELPVRDGRRVGTKLLSNALGVAIKHHLDPVANDAAEHDASPVLCKRKAIDVAVGDIESICTTRLVANVAEENIIAMLKDFGAKTGGAKTDLAARLVKQLHGITDEQTTSDSLEAPIASSEETASDFYEGQFMDFTGGDMDDANNTVAYWQDGLSIIRELVDGKWVYRCEEY